MKVYKCEQCQSVALEIITGESCSEKTYKEITANTAEASSEKHLPVVERNGDTVTVTVGAVEHPMDYEHYIMWIFLETKDGGILKKLNPGEQPQAVFQLTEGMVPVTVYEYCNLHGLWKTELG